MIPTKFFFPERVIIECIYVVARIEILLRNEISPNVPPVSFKPIWTVFVSNYQQQQQYFIYTRFAINIYKVLNWKSKSAGTPDVVKTNRVWSLIYSTLKMY